VSKILNIKILKYKKLITTNLNVVILIVLKVLRVTLPGVAVVYNCMDHAYKHPCRL
jgi:hypothetical protein